MSQVNPYQPMSSIPSDPTSIRKVSVKPFGLYQRGRDLIGEQYWLFFGITLVAMLLGSVVPMGLLFGVMLVGVFFCFILREQGRRVEFSNLFKGFEDFGPPLIASLIIAAVSTAIMLPFMCGFFALMIGPMAATQKNGGAPGLTILAMLSLEFLLFAVIILATLPFAFTFQLIADRRLPAMDAIKTSARGMMKNFWGVLWFFFVNMFVSMVLAILCYVPVFFFMPISFAAFFLLYRDIFPKDAVLVDPTL